MNPQRDEENKDAPTSQTAPRSFTPAPFPTPSPPAPSTPPKNSPRANRTRQCSYFINSVCRLLLMYSRWHRFPVVRTVTCMTEEWIFYYLGIKILFQYKTCILEVLPMSWGNFIGWAQSYVFLLRLVYRKQ